MQEIATLREYIEEGLRALPLEQQPVELYEPIRYTLELGGKRMRPILMLMACEMMGGKLAQALPPALGVELFHNFTLLHDDIMDEAPLRRGQPTVYQKYNANIAILSGDVMYTIACQQVAEAPVAALKPVLAVFHHTAIAVCEGQQYDMNFETLDTVTIEDYVQMITKKTAVLLGCSLQMGALIGGAESAVAGKLYEVGLHLGIAFQLQDDLLDTYGDPSKFGKQVGGDIIQNKKTYLLLQALRQADATQVAELHRWIGATSFDAAEKVKAVTAIFDQLQLQAQLEEERDRHFDQAMTTLQALSITEERKKPLVRLGQQLLDRDH